MSAELGGSVRAGADQRLLRAVTRFQARRRPDRRLCGWRGDYQARRLRTGHRLGCGPSARALVDTRTVFCLRELEANHRSTRGGPRILRRELWAAAREVAVGWPWC